MPTVDKLMRRLARLERQVDANASVPKLSNSSIDDGGGIRINDPATGKLLVLLGGQDDGTTTIVHVDGPPPPEPTAAILRPGIKFIIGSWDGRFVADQPSAPDATPAVIQAPLDFDHIEVHASLDPDATLELVGAASPTLITTLNSVRATDFVIPAINDSYDEHYVWLVARTRSGRYSNIGAMASETPGHIATVDVDPVVLGPLYDALAANEAALAAAQASLNTLTGTTLPALQAELDASEGDVAAAEAAIATLTGTTLPALQAELDASEVEVAAAQTAITTLTGTTLPALQDELDGNEADVAAAQAAITTLTDTTLPALQATLEAADADLAAATATVAADLASSSATTATAISDAVADITSLEGRFPITAPDVGFEIGGGNCCRNSSFESDVDLIFYNNGGGNVIERAYAGGAFHGDWYLRVEALAENWGYTDPFYYGVTPGQTWTFSLWVRPDDDQDLVLVNYRPGSYAAEGPTVHCPGGQWRRLTLVQDIPDDETEMWLSVRTPGRADIPGSFDIDAVQFERGNVPTAYAPRPDEILPGTITVTEIADDSITTPKLVAGSVVTGKIAAGAVTANEIAANTITAAKIAAGTITATQLAAGSVTAAKIVAGAVTTEKLSVVSLGTNGIPNGGFDEPSAADATLPARWVRLSTAATFRLNDDPFGSGRSPWSFDVLSASNLGETSAISKAFPVKAGTTYALSIDYISNVNSDTGNATASKAQTYVRIFWMGTQPSAPYGDNPTTTSLDTSSSTTPFDTFVGDFQWHTLTATVTPPATAKWALVYLSSVPPTTGSTYYQTWDNLSMQEVVFSAAIADGAITTPKLIANAVTAAKIAANAVTADKIIAGAITAEKLTIGTTRSGLLLNGGFEDYNTTTGQPDAWYVIDNNNAGGTFQSITAAGVTGSRCLEIALPGGTGWYGIGSKAFPVVPGRTYVINASLEAQNAGGDYIIRMLEGSGRYADGTVVTATHTDLEWLNVTGITAWTPRTLTWVCPAGVTWATLEFFNFANNGWLRVDDVSVSEIIVSAHIADGAITTPKLVAGAVTANEIAANTITAAKIAAGTITATQLAAGSVTATQLAAGSVTAAKIVAGTITATELAANTITAAKIAAGTITATEIAAGTITATQIAAGTITASKIATDTITANEIAAGAITTNELAAGSVTAAKIVAGTITANEIAAGTITAANILSGTITALQIAADTITANEIAAGAITTNELAAGSVTAAKIVAGTITATELAAGTITAAKLSATAIDGMTITGSVLQTSSSGQRIVVSGVGSDDIIRFYSGVTSEVAGAIDPQVSASRPSLYIYPGTSPTYSKKSYLNLVSDGSASQLQYGADLHTFYNSATSHILMTMTDAVAPADSVVQVRHLITDGTGWLTLPLSTNYAAFGGVFQTPQYKRVGNTVHLRGVVGRTSSTAAANTVFATLPTGARPTGGQLMFNQMLSGAAGRVDINSSGQMAHVLLSFAVGGYLSLDGIQFAID